jgi:hypothetical protein
VKKNWKGRKMKENNGMDTIIYKSITLMYKKFKQCNLNAISHENMFISGE